jgi:hypothetical protein
LPAARQASEEMNTPCTQSFNHRTSPLLTSIQHFPNIPLDIWATFHGISNRLTLPVIVSPPMQTRQRMSRGAGSHVSVISRSGSPEYHSQVLIPRELISCAGTAHHSRPKSHNIPRTPRRLGIAKPVGCCTAHCNRSFHALA